MDGILCLDKPDHMTSFACCAVLRRLVGEKKAGHTGTLDPMATGVLPVLFGRATRAIPLLPVQDKRYTATLTFGYCSDTLDIWGKVEPTGADAPALGDIEAVLPAFRGEIWQVPPMMSALKRDGVRLYDLARRGIEVEREARAVTVQRLDIVDYDPQKGILTLDCACSKGTYIRTICDDLGRRLGCGAVMSALRRILWGGGLPQLCGGTGLFAYPSRQRRALGFSEGAHGTGRIGGRDSDPGDPGGDRPVGPSGHGVSSGRPVCAQTRRR